MSWIKENRESILLTVLASVISGIVGFFTAIMTVQSSIKELDTKIALVTTSIEKTIEPRIKEIDNEKERINEIQKDVKSLKRQNEISMQINNLLKLMIKQERKETIKELQYLIDEVKGEQR